VTAVARGHHLGECPPGEEPVPHEGVACLQPLVVDSGDGELHLMPLIPEAQREAKSSEPFGDDDNLHLCAHLRPAGARAGSRPAVGPPT
jgi:hypothetical protein